jgi:hypothetical protein
MEEEDSVAEKRGFDGKERDCVELVVRGQLRGR